MNRLSFEERVHILNLLCEGASIRATTKLTGASKNTVVKLLVDAGTACAAYHDTYVRDLKTARVHIDEIWSFTYADPLKVVYDTWTWTAMDADSEMILSYFVGGRDAEYAIWFMDDVAARLTNRVQLTSDGRRAYLEAVEGMCGVDVDSAQLAKIYGNSPGSEIRYDVNYASTGRVERQNLTTRMHMRRFADLTKALPKKVESHAHAFALHMMYYNFVRAHHTLRVAPAMAAGMTNRPWEIADIVKLVEDAEAKPGKRGPYKKVLN